MSEQAHDDEAWSIEGRYRLERADLLGVWHHLPGFRTFWQYLLFFPVALVLVPLLSPLPAQAWLPLLAWSLAGVVALGFALARWRSRWADAELERIGRRQLRVELSEEGIAIDSNLGAQRYAWEALAGVTDTAHAFLLYTSPLQFFVVPKRAFDTDSASEVADLLVEVGVRRELGPRLGRTLSIWAVTCAAVLLLFWLLGG